MAPVEEKLKFLQKHEKATSHHEEVANGSFNM